RTARRRRRSAGRKRHRSRCRGPIRPRWQRSWGNRLAWQKPTGRPSGPIVGEGRPVLLVLVIAGDHWRPGFWAASDHVSQAAGPLTSVTVAECDWPAWSVQPTVTLSPGWCCSSAAWSPFGEVTVWPSTEVITSPAVRPVWAAGV